MLALICFIINGPFNADTLISQKMEYRQIQRNLDPLDDFDLVKENLDRINKLLQKNSFNLCGLQFMENYLKILKKDLEIINKMDTASKEIFSARYRSFANYINKGQEITKTDREDVKLQIIERNLLEPFGKFSFMHFYTTRLRLVLAVEKNTNINLEDIILKEYNNFNNSMWAGNPELNFFQSCLCRNYESHKNYEKLIAQARSHLKTLSFSYQNNDNKFLTPYGFLLKGLVSVGEYDEAYEIYKSIPKDLLEIKDEKFSKILARIFLASMIMFEKLELFRESNLSHERYISMLAYYTEQNSDEFKKQIKDLEIKLKNNNDYDILKRIEFKYRIINSH